MDHSFNKTSVYLFPKLLAAWWIFTIYRARTEDWVIGSCPSIQARERVASIQASNIVLQNCPLQQGMSGTLDAALYSRVRVAPWTWSQMVVVVT